MLIIATDLMNTEQNYNNPGKTECFQV